MEISVMASGGEPGPVPKVGSRTPFGSGKSSSPNGIDARNLTREVTLSLDQEVAQNSRHLRGRLDQQPMAVAIQHHQPGPCDPFVHAPSHVRCGPGIMLPGRDQRWAPNVAKVLQ